MNHQIERRAGSHESEDALSPEILALLVTCGGEMREDDRAALADGAGAQLLHAPGRNTGSRPSPSLHEAKATGRWDSAQEDQHGTT